MARVLLAIKRLTVLYRKTRRKQRVNTPLFPQMEAAECGAASLGVLLAHFGRWVPMETLRDACSVGRDGSSAGDIVKAGRKFGLNIRGFRCGLDELRSMTFPAILFWEFNHFLVVEGYRRGSGGKEGGFYLNDPANGRRFVSTSDFSASFTGVVLCAELDNGFEQGGQPPGVFRALWPWFRGVGRSLGYLILTGLLIAVVGGITVPLLLRFFVDDVLAGSSQSTLIVIAALSAAVAAYLLVWLQQFTLRKVATSLSITNADQMLWHLFRLPSRYFAHRFAGDLASRVQIVDNVANNSSRYLVVIVIELLMSLLLLALMLAFDFVLGLIVALIGVANIVVMRVLNRSRTDENRQVKREQALLLGVGTAGLGDIDNLRASARENDFFVRWSGYQARELTARQTFVELGYVISGLPSLFLLLGSVAVLGFGGWRVTTAHMTIGTLFGFYVLATNFLVPIGRFVSFVNIFSVLEADMGRIKDVLDAPQDPSLAHGALTTADVDGDSTYSTDNDRSDNSDNNDSSKVATLNGKLRLAGHINLCDVTFGYQANREPLIKGFNLTVKPGQRVAIVGPTGSGKSTLLRLISGEYSPQSGQVLFEGVPIANIPHKVFTSSLAAVDQNIFLFSGSVRDNITMWNPTISDKQLVSAATDADIHDEIMARTAGYDSRVSESGRNFSGGQRQRLEIARALVSNPSVLLLDEASSTLDAVTEKRIDYALRRRGCTCVIVAHRLSTIRDCDQIIVLDRGLVKQRGTHNELIADSEGIYRQLVGVH